MRYEYRDTTVNIDDIKMYIYHSSPLPICPFWHKFVVSFSLYEFTKHRLYISFLDCFKIADGNPGREFKRK